MKSLSDIFKIKSSRGRNPKASEQASFDFITLIDHWEEIVGERLAKHTIPLKNQRKKLTILTNHPAFSQQLSFMEDVLVKKIAKLLPEMASQIKGLTFQTNSSFFEQKHKFSEKRKKGTEPSIHKFSPVYKERSKEAELLFNEVEDDEMNDSLKSIFIQSSEKS